MANYYDILGVSKDASEDELKKAYRKLSLQWHPDRNNSEEAKEKFQEINEAYDTLSDQSKRREYDMQEAFGGDGGFPGFPGGGPFEDINNFFNMMFHGGPGGPGGMGGFPGGGGFGGIHIVHNGVPFHFNMQKPTPIIKNITISLQQAYTGCSITFELERWVIENNTKRNEVEKVQMEIPAGAGADGDEVVVMRDRGNRQNGMCGDVKICIHVENNTQFRRNSLDLIYNKKISLKEALCGISFDIQHLNDKVLNLTSSIKQNIIKPNDKKVIPNLGMRRGDQIGNLIIEFEIEFPNTLTEEQISSLNTIL